MTDFYDLPKDHHLHNESQIKLVRVSKTKYSYLVMDHTYQELVKGLLLDVLDEMSLEDLGNLSSEWEMLGLKDHLELLKNTLVISNYFEV
jgi:hypothetical protein